MLANDTDIDSPTLTAAVVANRPTATLTLNANGSFTYVPSANFNGSDSFTYKANDGIADSNVATVTIAIAAVDDAPVAVDDAVATNEDTPVSGNVLTNDTDVGRRGSAHRERRRQPDARHADLQRQRQLHLHAERELQRQRWLHL